MWPLRPTKTHTHTHTNAHIFGSSFSQTLHLIFWTSILLSSKEWEGGDKNVMTDYLLYIAPVFWRFLYSFSPCASETLWATWFVTGHVSNTLAGPIGLAHSQVCNWIYTKIQLFYSCLLFISPHFIALWKKMWIWISLRGTRAKSPVINESWTKSAQSELYYCV